MSLRLRPVLRDYSDRVLVGAFLYPRRRPLTPRGNARRRLKSHANV